MYPHFEKAKNSINFIVDGKPFIALGGELHNSTAASLEYVAQYWQKLRDMGLNTVILGVSWKTVEPQEGIFDFSVVDGLIKAAESYGLKIIPIWFATWKNAASPYTPQWVQGDMARFPRTLHSNGRKNAAISCLSEECCKADSVAFSKLMHHIKEVDVNQTVIAVQVENESGVLGTARDYSDKANSLFAGEIPSDLSKHLEENRSTLSPYISTRLPHGSLKKTWREVFCDAAEEAFMCYYTASFINRVVQAGKTEYDIPMFVNGWSQQCEGEAAGLHPSGGPTSQMLDIWRCAAPSIDAFAGDLYLENFAEECAAYTSLAGNPLIIPEARKDKWMPSHAFYSIGNHDALCFSPFGIEHIEKENIMPANATIQSIFQTMTGGDTSELVRQTYCILQNMMQIICQYRGTGKMKGFLQGRAMGGMVNFSKYLFKISYPNFIDMLDVPAGGLIIELSEDEFIITGINFRLTPMPRPQYPQDVEMLLLEEGHFNGTEWVCERQLNGDELHLIISEQPRILKVKLLNFE